MKQKNKLTAASSIFTMLLIFIWGCTKSTKEQNVALVNEQKIAQVSSVKESVKLESIHLAPNQKIKLVRKVKGMVIAENTRMADPVCIDWYLTIYDFETGAILQETYLYTTCGEGGGPTPLDDSQTQCLNNATEAYTNLVNSAYPTSQDISSSTSYISPLVRSKNQIWKCLQGIGWALYSQEIGTVKLVATSPDLWAWRSISHQSISLSGMPIGGSVESVANAESASFLYPNSTGDTISGNNTLYQQLNLNFKVKYSPAYNCPGLNIVLPPYTIPYYSQSQFWNANP